MMQAQEMVISSYGAPEVLKLVNKEVPQPRDSQVLVRVLVTGVAFADIKMRHGVYPGAPGIPFAPGYDIVGEVLAVGPKVRSVNVGQRVAALTVFGGYTTACLLDEEQLVALPDNLTDSKAVALVLNYLTAYQMMVRDAHLNKGDSMLAHGAAGGVGTALLQLAKVLGIRAYGTASLQKHPKVQALGATPIDYKADDFVGFFQRKGLRVDAVFDPIGGNALWQSRKILKPDGTLVAYGFMGAVKDGQGSQLEVAKTFLNWLLMKGMPGPHARFYAIVHPRFGHGAFINQDLKTLFAWASKGLLDPEIACELPLSRAADAHTLLEQSQVTGKIVLRCNT